MLWRSRFGFELLLMAEILGSPAEVGSLSYYLQGFIHFRWCRISAINSMFYISVCVHFFGSVTYQSRWFEFTWICFLSGDVMKNSENNSTRRCDKSFQLPPCSSFKKTHENSVFVQLILGFCTNSPTTTGLH